MHREFFRLFFSMFFFVADVFVTILWYFSCGFYSYFNSTADVVHISFIRVAISFYILFLLFKAVSFISVIFAQKEIAIFLSVTYGADFLIVAKSHFNISRFGHICCLFPFTFNCFLQTRSPFEKCISQQKCFAHSLSLSLARSRESILNDKICLYRM